MAATPTVLAYFLYSFAILFREGFEALIVVVALLAGAAEAGQGDKARGIYLGTAAAIVLSTMVAWSVNHLLADDTSDRLEGIFQFAAAGTLFYVSSWLTSKVQAEHWQHFIQARLETARQSLVPAVALGLTAFLAVMREGAETIVFFQALLSGATLAAEQHAVMAGVAAGAGALALTFIGLQRAAARIPYRALFAITSVLLYGLAVVFIGQGVASWQEAGLIAASYLPYVPAIEPLGIFPTVQTLAAQAALIVVAAATVIVPRHRMAQAPKLAPHPTGQPTLRRAS